MIATKELSEDELNEKWKQLFSNREEMELAHVGLMDEVWGDKKPKLVGNWPPKKKEEKSEVEKEMEDYQIIRKKQRDGK